MKLDAQLIHLHLGLLSPGVRPKWGQLKPLYRQINRLKLHV
jgi:hypothetical protein